MNKSARFSYLGWFSLRNRWTYALTMPCFTALFSYLLIGDRYWHSSWIFTIATLVNGAFLTAVFRCQSRVAEWIARQYPDFGQTMRRILFILLAHIVLSAIFLAIIIGLYSHLHLFGVTFTYSIILNVYLVNLGLIMLGVGLYETFYSFHRWQQVQVNKEKLKKENLKGQLQGLKSQINPHFLFNSLNSLSSLIADEPQRAEEFVDQMARVYRYMLQTNRQANLLAASENDETTDDLTTLETELAFIDSYYHLLKTRHSSGLYLDVRVAEQYQQHHLPPLTLQLLVENAVKHNVILASRPLYIEITTTDAGYLRVRNNLQKRTGQPAAIRSMRSGNNCNELGELESTPMGLANIQAKYQLLSQSLPLIETGPEYFTVTLPLLTKSAARK